MKAPKRRTSQPNKRDRRRLDMYDHRWRQDSVAFIHRYPFCSVCLCKGEINEGAASIAGHARSLVVDHLVPHNGDKALFWDVGNWQVLCRTPCHDSIKQAFERNHRTRSAWIKELAGLIREHHSARFIHDFSARLPRSLWLDLAPHVLKQMGRHAVAAQNAQDAAQ